MLALLIGALAQVQTADTDVVRRRPAEAREQMARWITQGSRPSANVDSLITLTRRLAATYATVWEDSFPLRNVERFREMSVAQRSARRIADSLRLAGNDASTRSGFNAAMSLWHRAYRRSAAIPDTAGMGAAMGNLGAGFYQQGELDSALHYLERAAALADAAGDRRTRLNAVGVMGAVAMDRVQWRRADSTIRDALGMRTRIGDVRGAAADHTNLGLIAAELGDGDAAATHYDQAITLARQHELTGPHATALLNFANLAMMAGEYVTAETRYQQALALYERDDDEASAGLVHHNLGLLATQRGDYALARTRLERALRILGEAGEPRDLIQVRRDLANVHVATGRLRNAQDELARAERLLGSVPDSADLVGDLALARADLSVMLNVLAVADRQYALAQSSYHASGNTRGEAEALHGQAALLAERRQFGRALALLAVVARSQRANQDRRSAALTQLSIGGVRQESGDSAGARRDLTAAHDSLAALGDTVGVAAASLALADLELRSGAVLAAEQRYRRLLATLDARPAGDLRWQARAGLGRALRARAAPAEAASELERAATEIERTSAMLRVPARRATFLADKWDIFAELASVEVARGRVDTAFVAAERMRSREMLERIPDAPTAESDLARRERELRARIADLTQRLESAPSPFRALRGPTLAAGAAVTREALARAQEQYAQLRLEMLDAQATRQLPVVASAGWRDIAARLGDAQAMLAYVVSDSTTLAFVIARDSIAAIDLRASRAAVASLVDFARGTMSRSSRDAAWATPLARLDAMLVAPVEATGLLRGIRQLVIIPHAELHYLPFGALMRRGASDAFLIQRYEITYAPSATSWLRLGDRPIVTNDRVFAVAPRVRELPASRDELDAIGRLYGRDATILMGAAATERAFRAAAPSYGVLHLATYGVMNQHNPLFSFVELAPGRDSLDGRLEVHEVLGMNLHARLVVLSACQTALASGSVADVPAGDDWVGLVRAFLGAGAQKVIASLWAVEDRSTATLMERLHAGLRSGLPETAALARAQREILRNPATASPFYWAGFVLSETAAPGAVK